MEETLTFEERFGLLQETIGALEQGGLPLDEAIARFERGIELAAQCRTMLDEAELRVTKLIESELLREVPADDELDEDD